VFLEAGKLTSFYSFVKHLKVGSFMLPDELGIEPQFEQCIL